MPNPITSIPVPAVLQIRNGTAFELDSIFTAHDFKSVLFLFDEFTFSTYKEKVLQSLPSIRTEAIEMQPGLAIEQLIKQAFSFGHFDAVAAMGGGTVIDYGKFIAHSRNIPFISIPTSPSNDGFASSNCSLYIDNKKTTVPAKVPYGILVDLDIIQNSPDRFILAGIGDLMSNITALYDWEFEERHGVGQVNAFALMISKKAVNSFIRTPMDDIKNPIFLKELVSSLTMGGVSTVISGNSAPISGSEHLISHALDKISAKPQMHGIQVGIATYIMANVQQHRAERMRKVFERTGFFEHIKKLGLSKLEYLEAIQLAPSIKPNRYTFLHDEKYRNCALRFVENDPLLNELFRD
jgi:glycerol-1-phosphate dehydrogenase [NAD(P)+]